MTGKGSGEIGPKHNPGEIESKNDGKSSGQKKEVKPLRHVESTTKQENDTSSSSPHTRELGDPTTRKLGDPTTRKLGSEGWKNQQFDDLLHGLGRSRITDTSGNNLPTKELRTETTQKLEENQDIQPIAEIPRDGITSQKSLSPEQKAQDRQITRPLYEDQRKHLPRLL